jgi:hypothetical protein
MSNPNKATVHLVALGKLSEHCHIPSNDYLNRKYPGITNAMRRGDIIENVTESGYRSQGVYMWDGKKVIEQNTSWDDYGSPSEEFKVVTEFPPGYWDKTMGELKTQSGLNIKKWCRIEADSQFYWHSDYPPVALDAKKLDLDKSAILCEKRKSTWSGEYTHYWTTFMWEGVEYKLNMRKPDYIKKFMEIEGLLCVYWYDGEFHMDY